MALRKRRERTLSKHGVVTLTETLYHHLAKVGARLKVSLLMPAWVDTQIWNADRNRRQDLRMHDILDGRAPTAAG